MTDLLQRVEQNIQGRHLLKHGQGILVAVSGGVDSMVLLSTLHELSKHHRWRLTVAHFNHQLRGRSSDDDERLVRKAAAALNLPFVVERADVRKFAEKSKLSIEMAARKLRHEFFACVARERKISTVALAHQADDQVELFFLRLLRGAGGEGLAGMKWRSPSPVDGKITLIRPLLDATKTELKVFARENKIHFREDATNAGLDMPRNRVRNELLPLLRRRYQPALAKAILRLMDIIGEEANFVTEAAQVRLSDLKRKWGASHPGPPFEPGSAAVSAVSLLAMPAGRQRSRVRGEAGRRPGEGNDFENLSIAIQRRALQLQLAELGIRADFDLVERLRSSPDVFVSVSPDFSISRDKAGKVSLRARPSVDFKLNELRVNLAGRAGELEFAGVRFYWSFADAKKAMRLGEPPRCESFDADKVGGQIVLRHWRAGDRFQPIGLKSAVKLQDLFTNKKIPRAQRHNLIVAEAANGEIFWVQNLRIAEHFKLVPETKRRLVWCWRCHSR